MLRAAPLSLLAILVMVAFLPVVSPSAEAASIPQTTFPPKFGVDVGPAQWTFATTGFTWASGSSSMTLTVPTLTIAVAGTNCAVAQSGAFSHNSTGYIWTSSWASACNGRAMSGTQTVYVKNTTKYNVKEVVVKGTWARAGASAAVVGKVGFPLSSTVVASVCDSAIHFVNGQAVPPCTVQVFGGTAFDFSAIAALETYDNSTRTVTASSVSTTAAAGSYVFDPLALDGHGQSTNGGNNCSSCPVGTLTTANANDIIIVFIATLSTTRTVSAVSGCSLTWIQRVDYHAHGLYEFYAVASGTLTNCAPTASLSSSINTGGQIFGISGADTSTIFDSNGAIPCTNSASSASTPTCTISTSNANDFVYADAEVAVSSAETAGACCTLIDNQAPVSTVQQADEYHIYSSTQTNTAIAFGVASGSSGWGEIADAVCQASCGGAVTTTVTTSVTTAFTSTVQGSTSVATTTTTTECFHGSQTVTSTSTFPSTTTITYTTTYTTSTKTTTTTTTVAPTVSVTIVVSTSFGVSSIVSVSTVNSVSVDTALIVSCGGSGGGTVTADPPSYLWLLLIPVAFLIALIARRRL